MNQPNNESAPGSGTSAIANGATVTIGEALKQRMDAILNYPPELEERLEAERIEQETQRRDRRRAQNLHEFMGSIGKEHAGCRLANFKTVKPSQKAAVEALEEYASTMSERLKNREGVVLFGPVGTGKDHLAISLAGIAVESHGKRAKLVNVQDWFGDIRDGMDTDRQERSLIRELAEPDVLILSDPLPPVGALSQHMATMLYRLVENRDSRGVGTWVTVNVATDQEADERFGAATWDRICHRAWKIHCNWPSYRKPSRTDNC